MDSNLDNKSNFESYINKQNKYTEQNKYIQLNKNIELNKNKLYYNNIIKEYIKVSNLEEDGYNKDINEVLVNSLYESIIQSAISECIITKQKFSGINSLLSYSQNYINNTLELGKLNTSNYIKLMSKINEIQNNENLFKLLCKKSNQLDSSIKYNQVSKKFLKNYHTWVVDPNNQQIPNNLNPQDLIYKNKLSLLEELEMVNENCCLIVKDLNDIINQIDSSLKNK